ncbi:MAG: hypothetical protein QW035_03975 [Candidatus Anstonellales archaeon]
MKKEEFLMLTVMENLNNVMEGKRIYEVALELGKELNLNYNVLKSAFKSEGIKMTFKEKDGSLVKVLSVLAEA